jgi:hypothetical protein
MLNIQRNGARLFTEASVPEAREHPHLSLPGFDLTAFWARSGLLFMTRDAGEPRCGKLRGNFGRINKWMRAR